MKFDLREVAESVAMLGPALEAVKSGQAGTVVLNAERLNASATGMSATTLGLLGMTNSPAYLAQVFREKTSYSPNSIMMKKSELRTRDIGTKKVDSLRINSSLQFEFVSTRSGYATVLNIGTSGKIWLQSPNAYVAVEQAKVESDKKYRIPGELLPNDQLNHNRLDYVEVGPAGWEELVVIVSDKPLVTEADTFHSTQDSPFVALSADRIEQLLDSLAELRESECGVGILSFLVEKPR